MKLESILILEDVGEVVEGISVIMFILIEEGGFLFF